MAEIVSWQHSPDARAVLARAVDALRAGRVVAFPTETSYALAASPDRPEAVERLAGPEAPALAVAGLGQALDLLPDMGRMGRRLARRCWPGPVTLVYGGGLETQGALSPGVRSRVVVDGGLALRSPAHSAILHAVWELQQPLVVTDALDQRDQADLVIDDGPCRYSGLPTVVRVDGERWEVRREGVVPSYQVQLQSNCLVLFVCTGNTCRSPLAEALCKKRLADRLGCTPDELPGRGFLVLSAGVAAGEDPAAQAAVAIAAEHGADLAAHHSQPLDRHLAVQADYLVCMTDSHLQAVLAQFPHLACEPRLLNPAGQDLPDPIGQDESVYRACAEQIWRDLEPLVDELAP